MKFQPTEKFIFINDDKEYTEYNSIEEYKVGEQDSYLDGIDGFFLPNTNVLDSDKVVEGKEILVLWNNKYVEYNDTVKEVKDFLVKMNARGFGDTVKVYYVDKMIKVENVEKELEFQKILDKLNNGEEVSAFAEKEFLVGEVENLEEVGYDTHEGERLIIKKKNDMLFHVDNVSIGNWFEANEMDLRFILGFWQ